MSDLTPLSAGDENDLAAAEYVLGVQSLPERQAAETRLRRDDDFAAAVTAWELRLEELNDAFDEAPPPDLMPKIEARLFGKAAARPSFWRSWLTGAVAAAALVVAAVVVLPLIGVGPSGTSAPVTVAILSDATQELRFDVARRGDQIEVTRVAGAPPAEGSSYELWLIAGDAAPVSLGLLDAGSETVTVSSLTDGMVLAVSLEPRGGSTTGAPSGPVLVSGSVAQSL